MRRRRSGPRGPRKGFCRLRKQRKRKRKRSGLKHRPSSIVKTDGALFLASSEGAGAVSGPGIDALALAIERVRRSGSLGGRKRREERRLLVRRRASTPSKRRRARECFFRKISLSLFARTLSLSLPPCLSLSPFLSFSLSLSLPNPPLSSPAAGTGCGILLLSLTQGDRGFGHAP